MSLKSLVSSGSRIWSDSVDPEVLEELIPQGITGATSNPIIISDLIKSGRFDDHLESLLEDMNDAAVAWAMTDYLVGEAQERLLDVWQRTRGDDGYVSFELDPLIDDPAAGLSHEKRVQRYVNLGRHWSSGRVNRMNKVPATAAGIEALESLAADGVTLNVTLIFTQRQYEAAREAIWRGAQMRKGGRESFKSVYSIFISRVDVYIDKHGDGLPDGAERWMGLLNAKRMWEENEKFWKGKKLPLKQEIVFASTGAKLKWQEPDYYVRELAGSDIQTNPPETNQWIAEHESTYTRSVDRMPRPEFVQALDAGVDVNAMEQVLMKEGIEKFASPQRKLLETVAEKRKSLKR